MPENDEGSLQYRREDAVDVPARGKEGRIGIRKADWSRIKRLLGNRPQAKDVLRVIYSILFGICATAGFSIYFVSCIEQKPTWLLSFYICTTIFSFIAAIGLCVADYQLRKTESEHLDMVLKDIEEVEELFADDMMQ